MTDFEKALRYVKGHPNFRKSFHDMLDEALDSELFPFVMIGLNPQVGGYKSSETFLVCNPSMSQERAREILLWAAKVFDEKHNAGGS